MADKNIISTSKKEIYTKLLDIAGKYIPDAKDGDFAKTGLFGYITESMAMAMRDSTFHTSMMYNELFLNTAVIPKSVYNWAKMFNIEVQKAEPSYANISIILSEDSIEACMRELSPKDKARYGKDINEYGKCIILDKEDPILAGDYHFSLEHSIVIYKKDNNNDLGYGAKYILSEYISTQYQDIDSHNCNLIVKYNNGNYEILARAYQYRLEKIDRHLTSSSFLNKIQRYNFEDQFCGAKLFAKGYASEREIDLLYSEIEVDIERDAAFYNLNSENELEISFKYGEGMFMPSVNSNLITYIYTTKGRNVPNSFTGTAIMDIKSTTFKTLPMTIQFTDGNIVGGKNVQSVSDIKKTIINEISTRNTITTQGDLDSFFGILTSMISTINDGKVKFIKQRDDIIKRIFNAYLLVRDNTSDISGTYSEDTSFIAPCVPTNTITGIIENGEVDATGKGTGNSGIIKVDYPKFTNSNGNYILTPDATTEDGYYISPFRIHVMAYPVETVKYVYDLVNTTSKLEFDSTGKSSFLDKNYIIPVSLNVIKNVSEGSLSIDSEDESYTFTVKTKTNFSLSSSDDGAYTFSGDIKISNKNNTSSVIISDDLIECISSSDNNDGSFTTDFVITVPSEYSDLFGSQIYLKNSTDNKGGNFNSSDKLVIDFSEFKINEMNLSDLKFRTEDEIVLFQELDDIMESGIIVNKDSSESAYTITIKDIPVIHSSFFTTASENSMRASYMDRFKGFTEQLFSYIDILKENLSRLETSTFFSLKFFNTNGTSYKYNTPTTNLDLNINVKLYERYENLSNIETLKREIRSFIRRVIDKMNETETGIRYSDIIYTVKHDGSYGKYIDRIEFVSMNDTYSQYISPVDYSDDGINTPMTPEWLNLDPSKIEDLITFE